MAALSRENRHVDAGQGGEKCQGSVAGLPGEPADRGRYARPRQQVEDLVQLVGYAAFATAMVLVVLHRNVAREYLTAYRAAHAGATPGIEWLVRQDPHRDVERLRRRRVLVVVPASVMVMAGILLVVSGSG